MNIKIDKKLNILDYSGDDLLHADSNKPLYIFGTLFGAYDGKKTYGRRDVIELFSETDAKEIRDFMRFCIGSFILVIYKNDILNIICSPSSAGFYYTEEDEILFLSDDEEHIFRKSDISELNSDEIVNLALNHSRTPFNTIFNDIKRVCGGCMLSVSRGLSVKRDIYILKRKNEAVSLDRYTDTENYFRFRNGLESVVKVIVENSESDICIVVGGVDSIALLIALSKVCPKHRLHVFCEGEDATSANVKIGKAICRRLGLECSLFSVWPGKMPELEAGRSFFISPFMPVYSSYFPALSDYFRNNNINSPIVISGGNMDAMYTVSRYGTGGTNIRLYPFFPILKQQIRYTKMFLSLVLRRKLKIFSKYDALHYLLSLISQTSYVPFRRDRRLKNIPLESESYIKSKESVLSEFFSISDLFSDIKDKKISPAYFNHILRVLHFLNNITSDPTTPPIKRFYFRYGKFSFVQPAIEGYMSDFFLSHQLLFKDCTDVKRYLYRYFKEFYGSSYLSFFLYVIHGRTIRTPELYLLALKRSVSKLFNRKEPCLVPAPDSIGHFDDKDKFIDFDDRQFMAFSRSLDGIIDRSSLFLNALEENGGKRSYIKSFFDKFINGDYDTARDAKNLFSMVHERMSVEILSNVIRLISKDS